MIKTLLSITAVAGLGVGATTSAGLSQALNPVTAMDMQLSYLDIAAETGGVSFEVQDKSEFSVTLKLRNGHKIKVRF